MAAAAAVAAEMAEMADGDEGADPADRNPVIGWHGKAGGEAGDIPGTGVRSGLVGMNVGDGLGGVCRNGESPVDEIGHKSSFWSLVKISPCLLTPKQFEKVKVDFSATCS